jgi:hypothetical protein
MRIGIGSPSTMMPKVNQAVMVMNLQTLKAIICEIDDVIEDCQMHPGDKEIALVRLSLNYWKEFFPELHSPAYDQLSNEEMEARWASVRGKDGLGETRHPDKVSYVLRWPAAGGLFEWLEERPARRRLEW